MTGANCPRRAQVSLREAEEGAHHAHNDDRVLSDVEVVIGPDDELSTRNWSGLQLRNVWFRALAPCTLSGFDFSDAVLENVDFTNISFEHGSFDRALLTRVDFSCRVGLDPRMRRPEVPPTFNFVQFRRARLTNTLFKYAVFETCNFKDSEISRCDFYRARFDGICTLEDVYLEESSIYRTNFTGSDLTRRNVAGPSLNGRILPELPQSFVEFHDDDHKEPDQTQRRRNLARARIEAAEVYANLAGHFASRGDGEGEAWAYVRRKQLERRIARDDRQWRRWLGLSVAEYVTGYGESLARIAATGLLLMATVTAVLMSVFGASFPQAAELGVAAFVGLHSEETVAQTNAGDGADLLLVVETALGMFLIGLFGFILGNKIRNR